MHFIVTQKMAFGVVSNNKKTLLGVFSCSFGAHTCIGTYVRVRTV